MREFLTEWLIRWGTGPVCWDDAWGSEPMWRNKMGRVRQAYGTELRECIAYNPRRDTYYLTTKGLEYLKNERISD